MRLFILIFTFLFLSSSQTTFADDSPPSSLNTFSMAMTVGSDYTTYLHLKMIGVCAWLHMTLLGPKISMKPEWDEYLPDLIVTVYNETGDDPWDIANDTLDKASFSAGNAAMHGVTGDELTDGRNASTESRENSDSEITKSVDVIGDPLDAISIPYFILKSDAQSFMPYYQSDLDSVPSRMGLAEGFRPETFNPFSHYIGNSFMNHWAYEFPRTMSVNSNNDYKASVSIALRAVDIVTNRNLLHVVNSTNDTCGKNCSVSNVIEETHHDHEIWQEIYPNNHQIQLGQSDLTSITPLYQDDINAGHGNYVFVVWRRYRGCVQGQGTFLWASTTIKPTQKR